MNPIEIAIFDSGVGGLSIVQEIEQRLPGLHQHYIMDDAAFPYGTKTDDFLIQRIQQVCLQAVALIQPQLLIIACNTASTLALNILREQLSIPVVGVVPAIKVAAEQESAQQIGLLATPATVNRAYTEQLIHTFAQGKTIKKLGCEQLVHWAEQGLKGLPPHEEEVFSLLNPWLTMPTPLTHVVLGCTHFPLLKPMLSRLWPDIHWIDSGAAIARRVHSLLNLPSSNHQPQASEFSLYWTAEHSQPKGATTFLKQLGSLRKQQKLNSPLGIGQAIQ